MNSILLIAGLVILGTFILYRIVKTIIENVKRERFRRKNREAQFSGSAVKEKKSLWTSSYSSKRGTRAERIGEKGEKAVSSYLADLECEDYHVFNDLLFRDGNYTTQIDHIILSHYGIFVIETKNVHGKVYGSANAEFWKQYLPDWGYKRYGATQEHQLRNPLWQNAGHIKSLRRLVFDNDIPIHGIVVFPYETDLYVTAEQPVLKMWQVVPYIKHFRHKILSADQVGFYRRRLLEAISTTESDRKQHLDNVNRNKVRRDTAVANGRCPRCGGILVLRSGKYGQFYGCSNYPRCKFILNK